MKAFLVSFLSIFALFFSTAALAFDPYDFNCDLGSYTMTSIPGVKKAPDNPVVGLNIKVLKNQVQLYLIKANQSGVEKDLFVTNWVTPDNLSQEGVDLLDLLGLFFGVDIANMESLRAGLPSNLLETFAYLELKDKSGVVTKLGFEGSNPSQCK